MMGPEVEIRWRAPEPRPGLMGKIDGFFGPGVSGTELWLQLGPAALAALGVLVAAEIRDLGWSWWKLALASLYAFDLVGGVMTNATSTAKRWYHRPGKTRGYHLGFVAVHLVHLVTIGLFFRELDWAFVLVSSAMLMTGAFAILTTPISLRRPTSMLCYLLALLVHLGALGPTPGLEWVAPVLYLNLFVCFLVAEAPVFRVERQPVVTRRPTTCRPCRSRH